MAVVQQAYVCGVSTRKVDQLVESLGLRVSRSEVSRVCAGLDEQVEAFRDAAARGPLPVSVAGREGGEGPRRRPGRAQVPGDRPRRARDRSPGGDRARRRRVRDGGVLARASCARWSSAASPACSSSSPTPTRASRRRSRQVLGCPWQRCTVHFLREALGHARHEQQRMLAALIRPIFNAESGEQARELARRGDRAARAAAAEGRRDARTRPRTTCSPSTPSRPTTGPSCAQHESARAVQPRDRPAHRRRRHLPRRPPR